MTKCLPYFVQPEMYVWPVRDVEDDDDDDDEEDDDIEFESLAVY